MTYDDGPSPDVTPALLKVLDEADVQATFFMTGSSLNQEPDIAKEVSAKGHLVAVHSMNHVNAYRSAPWTSIADTTAGIRALRRQGIQPRYFRPPYGKATLGTLTAAMSHGCQLIWWTHASGDTGRQPTVLGGLLPFQLRGRSQHRMPSADTSDHKEWLEHLGQHGGIVLFHDGDRSDQEDKDLTIALTKEVIQIAKSQGKTLATVQALSSPQK